MLSSSIGTNTLNDTANEYHINTAPADNQTALMFHERDAAGSRHTNSSWTVSWPHSPPYEYMTLTAERLRKYDWFRVSFCMKGKQPHSIHNQVKTMMWQGYPKYSDRSYRRNVDEYLNLVDLHNASHTGYFWNETSGWLHVRVVSEHVLSEAGTGMDNFGDPVEFDAYPDWVLRFEMKMMNSLF